jgi:hypothetical protein
MKRNETKGLSQSEYSEGTAGFYPAPRQGE